MKAVDVRATAALVLAEVMAGKSLNQALPTALEKVSERDRGLLQQLCYGTLRHQPRLQALLDMMLDKPLREKDSDVQGLLLCGLYQLEGMRIPDHAAVSATVAATRALKKPWAKGMTNALLRRYQREGQELSAALDEAATACHPSWLYHKLLLQWPQQATILFAANNQQPPMTLRLNTRRESREDYLQRLTEQGIEARAGTLSPQAVTLEQPRDILQLPGFGEGLVSVQDEAAQLAAHMLQAQPDERVLDACAAPGGKACHILELQPGLAELVAMDVDEQRLSRVQENLHRLDLAATLVCADAANPPEDWPCGEFDRILVDAPCSASGVIRRHPDVKLLRREQDIQQLALQQLSILQGLWRLLRPGGTLLYATCSVLQEENSAVIQRFLADLADAQLLELPQPWGIAMSHGRQVLPSPDGPDGLFYARLGKVPGAH